MRAIALLFCIAAALGCARVTVETAKPLQVDINMRLDIYQHVEKDVDSINDQIYGGQAQQMNFIFGVRPVYASEFSSEFAGAIERRRARLEVVEAYLSQGVIGENRNALLEVRGSASADIQALVSQENKDRETIYQETARKNNTDIAGVRSVFFEKDYQRAPSGYWFEMCENGRCVWKKK